MKPHFTRLNKITFFILLFISFETAAQNSIKGLVYDAQSRLPIDGAPVALLPSQNTNTDIRGRFVFTKIENNSNKNIQINCIGYSIKKITFEQLLSNDTIFLSPTKTSLTEVSVNSNVGKEYKIVSDLDIKMKGVNNSQEILRMVPGLFIGQHQGGGKAEQIFIRGFDCDHGTDINVSADGLPVNLVSQAHGQGYADMHFIIPETVAEVDFQKGPYNALKGNFTTSGYVDLKTKNALDYNLFKLEGGMFDSYRAVGMLNLLGEKAKAKQQSWYVASEYAYSNGFFEHPQDFKRFNFFTKYNGKISKQTYLSLTASTFNSKWNASGQIPDRAVADGSIGFYGAIDSTEGGETARSNINLQLVSTFKDGSYLKNQLYYSNYYFDLHTNFTFYLNDPINGDQIRQKENRNIYGYNSTYHRDGNIGTVLTNTDFGIGIRLDKIQNLELSHTKDRFTLLDRLAFGNVVEANVFGFINKTFRFSNYFSLNTGLRFDQFLNNYTDHLKVDSIFKSNEAIVSPKISLYYHKDKSTQYYINIGKGFHTNDTRVSVLENGRKVAPPAYSADLGTIIKPTNNLLLQAAIWYLWLDQEFVYSGDGAYVEPSGKTKRTGFDLSARYEPIKSLYIDVDLNYAHGRFVDELKGQNYIPLAPVWSSTGGITYKNKNGINGSIRYRWLSDRPAKEDNSIIAIGYFVNDFVLNFTQKKYEIGLSINNIFNVKWKETQFDTESRLKNEAAPVEEIHFTPGTKFAAKLALSIFF